MQNNTWRGSLSSANSIAPKLVTVCRWRTKDQWKCLQSFLLAEPLHTDDWHKVLAELCLLFQASCVCTYLDQVFKADQFAQNMDDISSAATNATDLTRKFWAVFEWIRKAGLKLIVEKCEFEFLGRASSPEGTSPQTWSLP